MIETIVVTTTFECKEDAIKLAKILLEKRLVACAQIETKIESLYWWKGAVQHENECRLQMKSTALLWEKLEKEIVLHHPYDVPEILATTTFAVSEKYQQWLIEELEQ